jgi:hypothetical protein
VSIVLESGDLTLLEPSGPVKACNGIALPFTTAYTIQLLPPSLSAGSLPENVQYHGNKQSGYQEVTEIKVPKITGGGLTERGFIIYMYPPPPRCLYLIKDMSCGVHGKRKIYIILFEVT